MTDGHDPFAPMQPITTHIDTFGEYSSNLAAIAGEAAAPFLKAVGDMAELPEAAFGKTLVPGDLAVEPVREGAYVQFELAQNLNALRQLFSDACSGIGCIADAAQVVANMYEQTDNVSSMVFGMLGIDPLASPASATNVDWAFADPWATAPTNVPSWLTNGTVAEAQTKAQANLPMSATGDLSKATKVEAYPSDPGHVFDVYTFPDGSKLEVTRTIDGTFVSAYDQNGNLISHTGDQTQYDASGQRRVTTVRMNGDENQGTRVTTVAVLNTDGSETITTTTEIWGNGITSNDGHTPATLDHTAWHETVVTIEPGSGPPTDGTHRMGPVEQLEHDYGQDGSYWSEPPSSGY